MRLAIDEFKALLDSWKDSYSSIHVSYIALCKDGRAELLEARIVLRVVNEGSFPLQFDLCEGQVIAGVEIRKFTELALDQLFDEIDQGHLTTNSGLMYFTDGKSPAHASVFISHHPAIDRNFNPPRVPAVSWNCPASKPNLYNERFGGQDRLEWLLRSSNPPFDDLADIFSAIGLTESYPTTGNVTVELVAQSPVFIVEPSALAGDIARIQLRTGKNIDKEQIWFSYIAHSQNNIARHRVRSEAIQWAESDTYLTGIIELREISANQLLCICGYKNAAAQRYWIVDPSKAVNVRHVLHNTIDPGLSGLNSLLFEKAKSDSHILEDAVAQLLHLLGLAVESFGRIGRMQDGPDLIAIAPNNDTFAVECTVGVITSDGKLSKLARRVADLRFALSKQPLNARVMGVMVTLLTREQIEKDIVQAATQNIAVVTLEQLQNAIGRLTSTARNPNSYFDLAQANLKQVLDSKQF